jgi:phosphomevalonate kinase
LAKIDECLSTLPDHAEGMRAARRSWRRLKGLRWGGLTPAVLHEYLDQCQKDLGAIHMAVSAQYFYRDQPMLQTQTQAAA